MNAQAHTPAQTPWPANPLAPYLALAALWLLTITIVPPRGDFPLNDDWMYAKVVKNLADTGRYEASPYADPTFILQAYWGAAFVKVFGFSFETLRVSTLVLALVAVWAAHWAAREAGLNTRWAFLVALTLMVNPLFLNLSYTFMTDVPFLALTTLSAAAFLRALRSEQFRWLWIAGFIAAAGFFIRQFALLIPIAVAPAILLRSLDSHTVRRRSTSIYVVASLITPWIAALILLKFLPIGGEGFGGKWNWDDLGHTVNARTLTILRFAATALVYSTIFLFPILWAYGGLLTTREHRQRRENLIDLAWFPAIAVLLLPSPPNWFPNLGNMLYNLGIGPLLLPGMVQDGEIAAPAQADDGLFVVLFISAVLGSAFLVRHLLGTIIRSARSRRFTDRSGIAIEMFLALLSGTLILILVLPPVQARFDRYFITAQVPLAILAARVIHSRRQSDGPARFGIARAALIYLFGIVCLQDYLAWNTARWKGLAALQREHAAPLDQINGGYEFNGWYHSDRFAEESRRTGTKIFGPLGWWTLGDDYRVSLRTDRHFEVIGKESYFSWLGFEHRTMLLLKRTTPDENFSVIQ